MIITNSFHGILVIDQHHLSYYFTPPHYPAFFSTEVNLITFYFIHYFPSQLCILLSLSTLFPPNPPSYIYLPSLRATEILPQ